jgi:hypothetical protein
MSRTWRMAMGTLGQQPRRGRRPAIDIGAHTYASVTSILDNNLDRYPAQNRAAPKRGQRGARGSKRARSHSLLYDESDNVSASAQGKAVVLFPHTPSQRWAWWWRCDLVCNDQGQESDATVNEL